LFLLLGHLAKADGRISETEVKLTEGLMDQMGLTQEHRLEAIRLFKRGAEADFDPDTDLQDFRRRCARSPNLIRMLLVYLVNLAMADGTLDDVEADILRRIAQNLGFSGFAFEQLLRMIQAQNAFARGAGAGGSSRSAGAAPRTSDLELAYQA